MLRTEGLAFSSESHALDIGRRRCHSDDHGGEEEEEEGRTNG